MISIREIVLVFSLANLLGILAFFVAMLLSDKGRRGVALALRSLWLHKMRSVLSVLGIIIGTSAVIALMAFGEGSMQDALRAISEQAKNVIVRSVKPSDNSPSAQASFVVSYGLTYEDYDLFQMIDSVTEHVPMRVFPHEIRRLEYVLPGRVVATTADYRKVHKINVLPPGRFLEPKDDMEMANVAVIGSGIAEELFPFENPLGKTLVLNSHQYLVIGVLTDRMPTGGTGGSQAAEQFNHDVYIPLRTCLGRFGATIYVRSAGARAAEEVELHQVVLQIAGMDRVRDAAAAVQDILERTHRKKDYAITVPLDRLKEAEDQRDRFTTLLALIAGISLLVGGIGIMNIMLATVTERTREIGIRRALGAKRRDIVLQFILEAMVQTAVGGLTGVLLGVLAVYGIPYIAAYWGRPNVPAQLVDHSIYLALSVSVDIGVLFGLYPAWRASRLDPIEALRHE
jgi:putative ABC transport system permease protein